MTDFRVRWKKGGDHIHARVFVSHGEISKDHFGYAMNGTLVFREKEWESFLRCFHDDDADTVTIIPEDGKP